MPLGLPSGRHPTVVQRRRPAWVQHLVNSGVTIWSDHPIQAAAATVWIQLGLGHLAVGRTTRPLVASRRAGEPGLGPHRVGLRRGVRWDLRPRRDLALRRAGRRPLLLRRRGPRRSSRARLFHATSRAGHRPPRRRLPHRHGRAASVAGPWVLAGPGRDADRDGAADGADAPAWLPLVMAGILVRRLRRPGARMGRQPLRRRVR